MSASKIECPLCGGSKMCGDHTCPECHGTGQVPNVFALAGTSVVETDEETAAAEGRPLAEVQAETRHAVAWIEAHRDQPDAVPCAWCDGVGTLPANPDGSAEGETCGHCDGTGIAGDVD